jgi:hypothetical protein
MGFPLSRQAPQPEPNFSYTLTISTELLEAGATWLSLARPSR